VRVLFGHVGSDIDADKRTFIVVIVRLHELILACF
jgi:hypothetical protein